MISEILFILWFFLPAGLANVAPIFAARIPFLNTLSYPLDCYKTLGRKRIFGDHKTVRGIISGIIIGILVVFLQKYFYIHIPLIHHFVFLNYASFNPIIIGTLFSLGALSGDAIKSFFKRQVGIDSGKTWFPFDQLDYIIGGILFTFPVIPLPISDYGILIILWFLLHLTSSFIGYHLSLKKDPL